VRIQSTRVNCSRSCTFGDGRIRSGIDVVRNKIKMFAQKKLTLPPSRHKIVILDEADSMTAAAQQALRRTMELHSSSTRFALAANQSTKIIEPIQSRCAVLRYTKLSDQQVLSRLLEVCQAEKVRAISCLFGRAAQLSAHARSTAATTEWRPFCSRPRVTCGRPSTICSLPTRATVLSTGTTSSRCVCPSAPRLIFLSLALLHWNLEQVAVPSLRLAQVCDQPHPVLVTTIINACVHSNLREATTAMQELWGSGYSAQDIITTVFRICKVCDMAEFLKMDFMREVGFVHMRIAEGANSFCQLTGLLAKLCRIAREAK